MFLFFLLDLFVKVIYLFFYKVISDSIVFIFILFLQPSFRFLLIYGGLYMTGFIFVVFFNVLWEFIVLFIYFVALFYALFIWKILIFLVCPRDLIDLEILLDACYAKLDDLLVDFASLSVTIPATVYVVNELCNDDEEDAGERKNAFERDKKRKIHTPNFPRSGGGLTTRYNYKRDGQGKIVVINRETQIARAEEQRLLELYLKWNPFKRDMGDLVSPHLMRICDGVNNIELRSGEIACTHTQKVLMTFAWKRRLMWSGCTWGTDKIGLIIFVSSDKFGTHLKVDKILLSFRGLYMRDDPHSLGPYALPGCLVGRLYESFGFYTFHMKDWFIDGVSIKSIIKKHNLYSFRALVSSSFSNGIFVREPGYTYKSHCVKSFFVGGRKFNLYFKMFEEHLVSNTHNIIGPNEFGGLISILKATCYNKVAVSAKGRRAVFLNEVGEEVVVAKRGYKVVVCWTYVVRSFVIGFSWMLLVVKNLFFWWADVMGVLKVDLDIVSFYRLLCKFCDATAISTDCVRVTNKRKSSLLFIDKYQFIVEDFVYYFLINSDLRRFVEMTSVEWKQVLRMFLCSKQEFSSENEYLFYTIGQQDRVNWKLQFSQAHVIWKLFRKIWLLIKNRYIVSDIDRATYNIK